MRSWGASGAAKVFMGHSALVYDVKAARTAAGTVIAASASEDCTCRVWDAESGQCMQILEMPGCAWAVDLVPTSRSPLPLLVWLRRLPLPVSGVRWGAQARERRGVSQR